MKPASAKDAGAMLSIGEVASRVGVPAHVLRYWETRFPQLKPLQRSGRRRYYRAADVALAERIYDLLHRRGYTLEGARKALLDGSADEGAPLTTGQMATGPMATGDSADVGGGNAAMLAALSALRDRLARALTA